MANPKTLIIPLDSQIAQLNNAGGKGANLSKLLQADFPVPPGFIITTAAYQNFVRLTKITGEIALLTRTIDPKDSQQLDDISRQIRGLFENKQVAPATKKQIISAYGDLDTGSVAFIRSGDFLLEQSVDSPVDWLSGSLQHPDRPGGDGSCRPGDGAKFQLWRAFHCKPPEWITL